MSIARGIQADPKAIDLDICRAISETIPPAGTACWNHLAMEPSKPIKDQRMQRLANLLRIRDRHTGFHSFFNFIC